MKHTNSVSENLAEIVKNVSICSSWAWLEPGGKYGAISASCTGARPGLERAPEHVRRDMKSKKEGKSCYRTNYRSCATILQSSVYHMFQVLDPGTLSVDVPAKETSLVLRHSSCYRKLTPRSESKKFTNRLESCSKVADCV